MALYKLKLYCNYGSNRSKRVISSDQGIEAATDSEAIIKADAAGIPKWDDSDHAILWSPEGKDIKHWTPNAQSEPD